MNDSRKFLCGVIILVIVGGTLAMSKSDDAFIIAKVGQAAGRQVKNALPESDRIAGPLNSIRTGQMLPISERVSLRIQSDKGMEGCRIHVSAEGSRVTLRGEVVKPSQRIRAIELAQSTTGVEQVVNEISE